MESVPLATTTGAMSWAGVLSTTGPARQEPGREEEEEEADAAAAAEERDRLGPAGGEAQPACVRRLQSHPYMRS